jgi:acetyltransferase
MELIIEYAKSEGLQRIEGEVIRENQIMLKMCAELGFEITDHAEDRNLKLVKLLLA